jgi:hypothetical protein
MPDDLHLPMPRRQPEDINLGRIQSDLEFIMERLSKLPTCQELALRPLVCDRGERGARSGESDVAGGRTYAPLLQVLRSFADGRCERPQLHRTSHLFITKLTPRTHGVSARLCPPCRPFRSGKGAPRRPPQASALQRVGVAPLCPGARPARRWQRRGESACGGRAADCGVRDRDRRRLRRDLLGLAVAKEGRCSLGTSPAP